MLKHNARVVPVIDLLGGQVVRAVGGKRTEYAPVQSVIAADSSPGSVARAFADNFGATSVYVADLDAIKGGEPDWASLEQIGACGLRVWLDCGIGSAEVAEFVRRRASAVPCIELLVVGLESLDSNSDLKATVELLGSENTIFSLDLNRGHPLTQIPGFQSKSPFEIAERARQAGFNRMIVLDLAFVGEGQGVGVAALCQGIRAMFPELQVIAGGGVRTAADIQLLADAGCHAVLVASALHDGSIKPNDLQTR